MSSIVFSKILQNIYRYLRYTLFLGVISINICSSALSESLLQTGVVKSKHGAWSILCEKPAGASREQCALMQNVIAEDKPDIGLSIIVLNTVDHKSRILRVLAPLGILLPNGLGLSIDGKDIGKTYFVRCSSDGCYAEVILEDELMNALKNGTTATFILFQTPEEGIGIPVDLKGFSNGYEVLP